MHEFEDSDRNEALQAAKLAVRAYARDPSPGNEAGVAEAFRRVRRLNCPREAADPAPEKALAGGPVVRATGGSGPLKTISRSQP
jgi:hypothetical protein